MNYLKCVHSTAMAVLVVAAGSPVYGEEAELLTDRPDFTETSFVVRPGRVQIEGGLTVQWEPRSWRQDSLATLRITRYGTTSTLPEALMRVGLLPRLELRLGFPDLVRVPDLEGGNQIQQGDSYLGAKIQLGPDGAPFGFAVIPAVSLPTGGDLVTSDSVDPEIVLTWSRDLGEVWSLGGIVGHARSDDGATTFPTVSLARSLGERTGTFLEWAAELVDGEDSHLIHHGYTFALGPNAQLDLHGGGGLTDSAPDFFIGAGFAFRR
jgi:outer membrane putative beta-barrel porin/alpha-amylase